MGELGLEMLETAPETHMGIREACTKRNRRSTWEPTLTWIRVVTGCSWYLRGKAPKAPMNTWLEMQVASRKPPGRRNWGWKRPPSAVADPHVTWTQECREKWHHGPSVGTSKRPRYAQEPILWCISYAQTGGDKSVIFTTTCPSASFPSCWIVCGEYKMCLSENGVSTPKNARMSKLPVGLGIPYFQTHTHFVETRLDQGWIS